MSLQSAKDLLAALKTDPVLLDKVNKAKTIDEKLAVARSAGYDFTADELTKVRDAGGELSDEALEAVAGGCGIEYCTLDGW